MLVRSPYNPQLLTRYRLTPDVVDVIGMCTKNPAPMLPYLDLLRPFGQYWYVTITPYGREIEPYVPGKRQVLDSFRRLSDAVGRTGWAGGTIRCSSVKRIPWSVISGRFPIWRRHLPAIRRPW